MTTKNILSALSMLLLLGACGSERAGSSTDDSAVADESGRRDAAAAAIAAAVLHPGRSERDRGRDAQRKPAEMLGWLGIEPGMKVLDVFTGSGWYAELLAHVVGPQGQVYAQNPPELYERIPRAQELFTQRLADERLPNVVRYDRRLGEFDDLPDNEFDAAVIAMVFHDFFWLTDDVPAALADIERVLKPGAAVLVTDHSAPAGTRDEYARDFNGKHRIDEEFVKQSFSAAGFELVDESQLLRQPDDDRSMAFFEMEGRLTDRFALKFRKPAG